MLFICTCIWFVCNADENRLAVHEHVDMLKRETTLEQPEKGVGFKLEKSVSDYLKKCFLAWQFVVP